LAEAPSSSNSADSGSQAYLPDFCATSTVFIVVIVAALVAIVLTLAGTAGAGRFLFELSKTALFVLWLSLLGCALLCMLRSRLEGAGKTRAFVFGFLILLAMCVLLAEIAYQLTRVFAQSVIIHDSHAGFLFRTFMVSAIIIALGMRYLYVSSEWRRSIVLEAQARISALQALIRPHFLFNSMNTIASLTRSDPRQAEEAVEDLSDLLRANLNTAKNRTTLKQELETAAIYQRIEKLRLGERLRVRWDVDDLPMRALIPSLTIQPLLENAIYHGIEQLPDGGEVSVKGNRDGKDLVISMSNPVATGSSRSTHGNKMAMSNIRQRFELAYGNRASVSVAEEGDRYTVSLRFPLEKAEA
jgi:two-component system sensor histidine kinase AlgZ